MNNKIHKINKTNKTNKTNKANNKIKNKTTNKANKIIKINLGDSINWRKRNKLTDWVTVDCYHQGDYDMDLRKKEKLPFASNSVDIVFSSHMIEHIDDSGDQFLFNEIHRILKPNGVFRVACPDYDKAMVAYENKDVGFFTKGGVITRGNNLERLVTNFFASFRHKNYKGNKDYSGGPIINVGQAKQIFASNDINKVVSWCVDQIPNDAHYKAHVNGFNFEKLKGMLEVAGFKNIKRSNFRKSSVAELRSPCFDNRATVSLYVESVKTIDKHIKINQKNFSDINTIYTYNKNRNLFICPETGHGYYYYNKNISDFHKNVYRQTKRAQRPGDFNSKGSITPIFHKNREIICSKRIEAIKSYIDKDNICLDIGGGAGTFSKMLSKYVKHVEMIEIDPILVQEAKRQGIVSYNTPFFQYNCGRKYDVVLAWHVLEHVEDIVRFIKKCKNLSKKYVVVEVPTNRRTPDEYKPPKEFDGHLHYFTLESLKMLLENCGLEIIEISVAHAIQKPAILAISKVNL